MKLKNLLKISMLSIISLLATLTTPYIKSFPKPNQKANWQMPKLSKAQMQKMERAFKQFKQHFDSLPADQQAKLKQEMQSQMKKEYQRISKMRPGQRDKYLSEAINAFDKVDEFGGWGFGSKRGRREYVQAPVPGLRGKGKQAAQKAAEEKTKEALLKQTAKTLKQVIDTMDKLSVKLGTLEEGARDFVSKWIKKGRIQKWAGEKSDGNLFMDNFNSLRSLLGKLNSQDPTTKAFLYIKDLKTIGPLQGQLELLLTSLQKNHQNLDVTKEGKIKLIQAKQALKGTVNFFGTSSMPIEKKIIDVIKTFNPEAIEKEEKEFVRRSEIAANLGKTGTQGGGGRGFDWGNRGARGFPRDSGYYRGGQRPQTAFEQRYGRPSSKGWGTSQGKKGRPTKKGGKGPDKKSKADKNKKKAEQPGAPKKEAQKKKKDDQSELLKDAAINSQIEALQSQFKIIDQELSAFEEVRDKAKATILDQSDIQDYVEGITKAQKAIRGAKRPYKNSLRRINKLKNATIKKAYKKKLAHIVANNNPNLNEIMAIIKKTVSTIPSPKIKQHFFYSYSPPVQPAQVGPQQPGAQQQVAPQQPVQPVQVGPQQPGAQPQQPAYTYIKTRVNLNDVSHAIIDLQKTFKTGK